MKKLLKCRKRIENGLSLHINEESVVKVKIKVLRFKNRIKKDKKVIFVDEKNTYIGKIINIDDIIDENHIYNTYNGRILVDNKEIDVKIMIFSMIGIVCSKNTEIVENIWK